MRLREVTNLAGATIADFRRELSAARRIGYIELEIVLTMPKYGWVRHPLRWLMHRLFNGAVIQTQIMLPTSLARKAAKERENKH